MECDSPITVGSFKTEVSKSKDYDSGFDSVIEEKQLEFMQTADQSPSPLTAQPQDEGFSSQG